MYNKRVVYPLKFRQHVLAIREKEKLAFDQTAKRFGVGIAGLMRRSKILFPVMKRNKPATKIDMQAMRQELIARLDDYQYERTQRLGVSQHGICDTLKRLGFTRKKTFSHPDAANREAFQTRIEEYRKSGKPVVYVDESGFATDMPRAYGWSLKGLCSHGKHDWQTKGRTNIIGASQDNRLINTCLFDCHINGDVFYNWLTQELLPCMPSGTVIVMDNASFHK